MQVLSANDTLLRRTAYVLCERGKMWAHAFGDEDSAEVAARAIRAGEVPPPPNWQCLPYSETVAIDDQDDGRPHVEPAPVEVEVVAEAA